MTTPIRPGPPQTLPMPPRSNAALEAQRAFFQSALQGSAAPQTAAPAQAARTPTVVMTPTTQIPASAATEEPSAVRLGRYLDIRV